MASLTLAGDSGNDGILKAGRNLLEKNSKMSLMMFTRNVMPIYFPKRVTETFEYWMFEK